MSKNEVPHVWFCLDSDGDKSLHLAINEEGARQAHLAHFQAIGSTERIVETTDKGTIGEGTNREEICFDPPCVLHGLSFPR